MAIRGLSPATHAASSSADSEAPWCWRCSRMPWNLHNPCRATPSRVQPATTQSARRRSGCAEATNSSTGPPPALRQSSACRRHKPRQSSSHSQPGTVHTSGNRAGRSTAGLAVELLLTNTGRRQGLSTTPAAAVVAACRRGTIRSTTPPHSCSFAVQIAGEQPQRSVPLIGSPRGVDTGRKPLQPAGVAHRPSIGIDPG